LNDARDKNDYDLQVAYTIQDHINVKISSSWQMRVYHLVY
jgi:hypothetical protein